MAGDLIIIFLLGIVGIWKAVPMGFILEAEPVYIVIMTLLGAYSGLLLIYFTGNRIRNLFTRFYSPQKMKKSQNRIGGIYSKYGAVGLGLMGSLVFGPNITMIIGLFFIHSTRNLLVWLLVGTFIWSITLTSLGMAGMEVIKHLI